MFMYISFAVAVSVSSVLVVAGRRHQCTICSRVVRSTSQHIRSNYSRRRCLGRFRIIVAAGIIVPSAAKFVVVYPSTLVSQLHSVIRPQLSHCCGGRKAGCLIFKHIGSKGFVAHALAALLLQQRRRCPVGSNVGRCIFKHIGFAVVVHIFVAFAIAEASFLRRQLRASSAAQLLSAFESLSRCWHCSGIVVPSPGRSSYVQAHDSPLVLRLQALLSCSRLSSSDQRQVVGRCHYTSNSIGCQYSCSKHIGRFAHRRLVGATRPGGDLRYIGSAVIIIVPPRVVTSASIFRRRQSRPLYPQKLNTWAAQLTGYISIGALTVSRVELGAAAVTVFNFFRQQARSLSPQCQ